MIWKEVRAPASEKALTVTSSPISEVRNSSRFGHLISWRGTSGLYLVSIGRHDGVHQYDMSFRSLCLDPFIPSRAILSSRAFDPPVILSPKPSEGCMKGSPPPPSIHIPIPIRQNASSLHPFSLLLINTNTYSSR
jgi:hypothetical protein